MGTYIVEIQEMNGETIGYAIYNSTGGDIYRPFYNSDQSVYNTQEYLSIIYAIYKEENWFLSDHKIDHAKFRVFLKWTEKKTSEKHYKNIQRLHVMSPSSYKGQEIDFEEWNDLTVDLFLDTIPTTLHEHPKYKDRHLTQEEVLEEFFKISYHFWKQEKNSLEYKGTN